MATPEHHNRSPLDADRLATPPTSLSLIQRVRAKDQEAWRQLVYIYGPLIHHWCRGCGLALADSADVAQEVFLAVAGEIATFQRNRPGQTFRGWLWGITRHKIGDHFRRRQRQPQAEGGSDAQWRMAQVPEEPPPDDQVDVGSGLAHRALEVIRPEFQERTWQAFWRAAVGGQAPAGIAADLGVTPDAVRLAKSRVLRRLRVVLTDLLDE